MRRYGLHDDQWNCIKDLLQGRKESVGVTANEELYRYRAGMPWRDLPKQFGERLEESI